MKDNALEAYAECRIVHAAPPERLRNMEAGAEAGCVRIWRSGMVCLSSPQQAIRLADGPGNDDPAEGRKRMLRELAERLDRHHAFAKGQFVVWKAGLKNKIRADCGEPAIVTGVYPSPIYDQGETLPRAFTS